MKMTLYDVIFIYVRKLNGCPVRHYWDKKCIFALKFVFRT